jgi:putative hydrolase of the HAD superfamily
VAFFLLNAVSEFIKDKKMFNINEFDYVIFDLDNTLYDRETGPIKEVEINMDNYVSKLLKLSDNENRKMRKYYFEKYGTTLRGLQIEHNIDPIDYLEKVHDVDANKYLSKNKKLQQILKNISSKKYILTNSYKKYALNITDALGITKYFDDIFDNTDMNCESKKTVASYKTIITKINADYSKTVMIDDVWNYLISAKNLNIFTILVNAELNENENPDLSIKNIYELEKYIY